MNRDLAKYLLSLKNDVSRCIWLSAISKAARNGTVNLMYKDMLMEHGFQSKAQLAKYFNPLPAANLGVIKILVQTDSFVSINFKLGTKQQAGASQFKIITNEAKALEPKTETVTPAKVAETAIATNSQFLTDGPNYKPTQKLIYGCINDYINFFKNIQVSRAIMVGATGEGAPPKMNSEDIKHIKELCKHFAKLPGISTEEAIQACFQRIYNCWFELTDHLQRGFDLRYISQNINQIIIQIQNLNNGSKDKREQKINEKIDRAGQKDYSRLANSRKKDN